MSKPIPPGKAPSDSACPDANSGAIVLVLDAPAANAHQSPPSSSSLPKNFRTMTDDWHHTGSSTPPSRQGLDTLKASGSAQYCKGQLQKMLSTKSVSLPMTIVDLRQESHGFFQLDQPLQGESTIAVGWFAERDWMSIGKGLVSVEADEKRRLQLASSTAVTVYEITSVNSEGGICTTEPYPVNTVGWATERQIAQKFNIEYIRFPTTDHVRPRDEEVDRFVAFDTTLEPGKWLHFHCRGGDGRTTTFLAMHDIIHNAPKVTVDNILIRQYWLGGIDLYAPPPNPTKYQYPFAVEREEFIRHFYDYVCEVKPDFNKSWSAWVANKALKEVSES